MCYFGVRDAIDVPSELIEILEEPFKTAMRSILLMCAYAGTGDVLTIQKLLHIVGQKIEVPPADKEKKKVDKKDKKDVGTAKTKTPKAAEWDYGIGQAMATLGVAVISIGEDIGKLGASG